MAAIVGTRQTPQDSPGAERLPPIRTRPRYMLMWHPLRWDWSTESYDESGVGWLPSVSPLFLTPGCNGVGDGNVWDLAAVRTRKAGWHIIMPDDPRLGPHQHYMQRLPARGRAAVWASIWESVSVLGGQVRWQHDDAGYRSFLRHIVEAGIVSPMDDVTRDAMIHRMRERCETLETRIATGGHNPAAERRLERQQAILAAMEGAGEGAGADKPEPKRRAKRAES